MSIESALYAWMDEAIELRYGSANDPEGVVTLPNPEAGFETLVNTLARIRVRLDRVQELQTLSQRARARARRIVAQKEFEAQEAFDRSMQNRGARRAASFTTREERNADASLDSFEQKREAHQASRMLDIASETLEVITSCYWGLSGLREEILTLIRAQQHAGTSLEYSTPGGQTG